MLKPKIKFFCKVESGKLILSREKFNKYLKTLKDGNYSLLIEPIKRIRSLQQNRLYWLYLNIIEQDTGHFADDLHLFFKRKFLTPKCKIMFDEKFYFLPSTTELSKLDFSEYIDKIEKLTGISIPNTEDYFYNLNDQISEKRT